MIYTFHGNEKERVIAAAVRNDLQFGRSICANLDVNFASSFPGGNPNSRRPGLHKRRFE